MSRRLIALGVDPGTLHLGWGVVRRAGTRVQHVAHGVLHASPSLELAARLVVLADGLAEVVERHRPAVASVETLFFHRDASAAAKLGHARGVVLLVLARAGVEVAEYAPALVKRTVAGHGRAEKPRVAEMVRRLLALASLPPADAADALALALTRLRLPDALPKPAVAGPQSARHALARMVRERGRGPAPPSSRSARDGTERADGASPLLRGRARRTRG